MSYIVAIHIPIAGLSLIPVFFGWPLILYPVHIVFLELIIDPACSVVFEAEPEESEIMRRPPRKISEPIFNTNAVVMSLMQGFAITLLVLTMLLFGMKYGLASGDLRAISFVALVIANLGLIIVNLSIERSLLRSTMRQNKALTYVLLGTIALLALILEIPFLRDLFNFSELHLIDIAMALGAGLIGVVIIRWIRRMFRRIN
jgi:Ca2+-transporting ATPase